LSCDTIGNPYFNLSVPQQVKAYFKKASLFPVKPIHINVLKNLALLGALRSSIPMTSEELGGLIGRSQQSASRILRDLKNEGMIEISRGRKSWIRITDKGKEILLKEYGEYRAIFEKNEPSIKGKVESGMGEGRYYLSKSGYVRQIEEIFGFKPYAGTLNLRLSPEELAKYRAFLSNAETIKGFVSEGRTFGDVLGIPAEIGGIECAIITPKRTHYSDVIEVIAPVKLRDALPIKDGDVVELKIKVKS
jgi:riboflavin kinase